MRSCSGHGSVSAAGGPGRRASRSPACWRSPPVRLAPSRSVSPTTSTAEPDRARPRRRTDRPAVRTERLERPQVRRAVQPDRASSTSTSRRRSSPRARRSSPPTARAATAPRPTARPASPPTCRASVPGTVDFWVSTGRMPLADTSVQAIRKPPAVQPAPDARDRRLGAVPHPGRRAPRSRSSTPPTPTSRRATPSSPSTARRATPSPAPVTRWPTGPTRPACTWPPPPRSSRPSGRARATCRTSARATSPTPRHVTSPPTCTASIQHPANPGGVGLGGIGPVGEGFVGLLLGVGVLMLVCFWIGDRT